MLRRSSHTQATALRTIKLGHRKRFAARRIIFETEGEGGGGKHASASLNHSLQRSMHRSGRLAANSLSEFETAHQKEAGCALNARLRCASVLMQLLLAADE